MTRKRSNSAPKWSDVKAQLENFDRRGLTALVQVLYEANPDNRTFLHARLGLGEDPLAPYKETIARWLWPNILKDQDVSVSRAKKAVSDYKKASGDPAGMAELMIFYCEQAAGFSSDVGMEGDSWFDAMLGMFTDALKLVVALPEGQRVALMARLDAVRTTCHDFGYGVGSATDYLIAKIVP